MHILILVQSLVSRVEPTPVELQCCGSGTAETIGPHTMKCHCSDQRRCSFYRRAAMNWSLLIGCQPLFTLNASQMHFTWQNGCYCDAQQVRVINTATSACFGDGIIICRVAILPVSLHLDSQIGSKSRADSLSAAPNFPTCFTLPLSLSLRLFCI